MPDKVPNLGELRAKLDEIDTAVHDLLMRRADITRQVGEAKADVTAPVHRPAREAQILRRLVLKNRGWPRAASIIRIWREIIASSVQMQGRFRVACIDDEALSVAREHYGVATPLFLHDAPLKALADKRAELAIVPLQAAEDEPWWSELAELQAQRPEITLLWNLPFAIPARHASVQNGQHWMAIGVGVGGGSGDDYTLVAGSAELASQLHSAGISDTQPVAQNNVAKQYPVLLEIAGYRGEAELQDALSGKLPFVWLGSYPTPILIED